jgi:hypothetical protein
MAWNKKAGKTVGNQKAQEMIDRYQKEHKDSTRSVYYDVDVIRGLLEVNGVEGISIFFAKNDAGLNTVVLYPVDADGKIIKNRESSELKTADTDSALAADLSTAVNVGSPCPPYCPK